MSSLFERILVPDAIEEVLGDRGWIEAMLAFERELAAAQARVGLIETASAEAIATACAAERYDVDDLVAGARRSGNPAEPLVRALREDVEGDAAADVHRGATSQDVLDTATSLVARRVLALIDAELGGAASSCAQLAEQHRNSRMASRTLMQQALPTTFGRVAAGWLVGLARVRDGLRRKGDRALAVQLGGGAGTLDVLGDAGPAVVRELAAGLGLAEPELPWHSERSRVAQLGGALAVVAGACDKVALDVILLSQSEIGELSEAEDGRSSAMAHKRNPAGSIRTRAAAAQAIAHAGVLPRLMAGELERGAGSWHTEWVSLRGALAYTGGAAASLRQVLGALVVHVDLMQANLAGGSIPDPDGPLGAAGAFIDAALALHREARE